MRFPEVHRRQGERRAETQTRWTFEPQQESQGSDRDKERLSSDLAEARLRGNSELEDNCSAAWKQKFGSKQGFYFSRYLTSTNRMVIWSMIQLILLETRGGVCHGIVSVLTVFQPELLSIMLSCEGQLDLSLCRHPSHLLGDVQLLHPVTQCSGTYIKTSRHSQPDSKEQVHQNHFAGRSSSSSNGEQQQQQCKMCIDRVVVVVNLGHDFKNVLH